jgi:hypothetical protein
MSLASSRLGLLLRGLQKFDCALRKIIGPRRFGATSADHLSIHAISYRYAILIVVLK